MAFVFLCRLISLSIMSSRSTRVVADNDFLLFHDCIVFFSVCVCVCVSSSIFVVVMLISFCCYVYFFRLLPISSMEQLNNGLMDILNFLKRIISTNFLIPQLFVKYISTR